MITQPICKLCEHYQTARLCPAFNGPIPDVIWRGRSAHLTVVDDQREPLTFKARTGSASEAVAFLERLEDQS